MCQLPIKRIKSPSNVNKSLIPRLEVPKKPLVKNWGNALRRRAQDYFE